jgi:hypothetical protein
MDTKIDNEETSKAGSKWTIEEDNKTYEEIALEHKRTIIGIKSRVISHVIYPKHKDNIDIDKLSEDYNIDIQTLKKYINKLDINKPNETKINNNKIDRLLINDINRPSEIIRE